MLQMKVVAVKVGTYRDKTGKEVASNRCTFITDDGDSFKINTGLPIVAGDVVEFGIRSAMSDKGFPLVALTIDHIAKSGPAPGGGK